MVQLNPSLNSTLISSSFSTYKNFSFPTQLQLLLLSDIGLINQSKTKTTFRLSKIGSIVKWGVSSFKELSNLVEIYSFVSGLSHWVGTFETEINLLRLRILHWNLQHCYTMSLKIDGLNDTGYGTAASHTTWSWDRMVPHDGLYRTVSATWLLFCPFSVSFIHRTEESLRSTFRNRDSLPQPKIP